MLIFGRNEAHDRLMKELHEKNPEGTEYPQATNNRGSLGGKYINPSETGLRADRPREKHAHGDRVGMKHKEHHSEGDYVGERSQPGEHLPMARKKGGHHTRKHHSAGEEVVPASAEQPGEHLKRTFKKGGRAYKDGGEAEMKRGDHRR